MATPAPACKALLWQAQVLWPNRNRASDGIIGDARHQAKVSDHNEGNAADLTHDPANGCDAHAIADRLKASGDPRIKYVISNGRIWNPSISPNWRTYNGPNPHTKHTHVSIHAHLRDDVSAWALTPPDEPEDDMPYKDWPQEDKMLLANDVASAIVAKLTEAANPNDAGGRIKRATRAAERLAEHFEVDLT